MTEKDESPASPQKKEDDFADTKNDPCGDILFDALGRILLPVILDNLNRRATLSGFLEFWQGEDAIRRLELNHDTRITIMSELRKSGVVELVEGEGWQITNPPWLENPPKLGRREEIRKRLW